MATKKGISFIIPLVVYPFDIMVSVGQSDIDFRRTLEKHMPPNCRVDIEDDPGVLILGQSVDGRTINFKTGHQTVIRLKRQPKTARDHGIIAHEIFHAVSFVLWRMSIHLEIEKTDEVYAYMVDYVTAEFYKNINLKR